MIRAASFEEKPAANRLRRSRSPTSERNQAARANRRRFSSRSLASGRAMAMPNSLLKRRLTKALGLALRGPSARAMSITDHSVRPNASLSLVEPSGLTWSSQAMSDFSWRFSNAMSLTLFRVRHRLPAARDKRPDAERLGWARFESFKGLTLTRPPGPR